MVHAAPSFKTLPMQLSLSMNGGLATIDVIASAMPPSFVRVIVCAGLAVPTACAAKVSELLSMEAVVSSVPAVHNGICQIPRPYVAATRTAGEGGPAAAGGRGKWAEGKPRPKNEQQVLGPMIQVTTRP